MASYKVIITTIKTIPINHKNLKNRNKKNRNNQNRNKKNRNKNNLFKNLYSLKNVLDLTQIYSIYQMNN